MITVIFSAFCKDMARVERYVLVPPLVLISGKSLLFADFVGETYQDSVWGSIITEPGALEQLSDWLCLALVLRLL